MERVGSADMGRRVRQNGRKQTSLMLCRDRSMASFLKRKIDNAFVDNHVAHPGKDQPLGKEGRAEVHDRNARPVEDAFGDPVIARRVALGILARGNLRHIDHGLETRPLGRVREVGRRLDEPGADRIAEVGSAGPGRRADGVVVLQEVAGHDLRPRAPQRLGTLVLLVDQCADGMPLVKQMPDGVETSLTACARYQDRLIAHRSSPCCGCVGGGGIDRARDGHQLECVITQFVRKRGHALKCNSRISSLSRTARSRPTSRSKAACALFQRGNASATFPYPRRDSLTSKARPLSGRSVTIKPAAWSGFRARTKLVRSMLSISANSVIFSRPCAFRSEMIENCETESLAGARWLS